MVLVLVLSLPVLAASMGAGLVVSLLSRTFKLSDSGLAPLSRAVAGLVALLFTAGWMGEHAVSFSSAVLEMLGH